MFGTVRRSNVVLDDVTFKFAFVAVSPSDEATADLHDWFFALIVWDAPATIILAAEYDRTRTKYPDHGDRYVHMEAGHAAQNVHLVCESRDLNTCPVGAFSDADVPDVLDLPERLDPLYLLPFGHRRTET